MSIVKFKYVVKNLLLASAICLTVNSVYAVENVLQAIQIEGVKDTYNIVLKSDDNAEVKKTIQAPNKMLLDIKGIRASKSINTIYSNTSSVDSVVVEQTGNDTLKIFIQGDNVANADVKFDSLKTPVLKKQEYNEQVVLSSPMETFKPVYEEIQEDSSSVLDSELVTSVAAKAKGLLKDEKISWTIVFGLFAIIVLNGVKKLQPAPTAVKIGLGLKDREVELYKNINTRTMNNPPQTVNATAGLKAYQSSTRSPYMSTGLPPRKTVPSAPTKAEPNVAPSTVKTMQRPAAPEVAPKVNNIDSMKFLESMTKIYEKSGRPDLAQGLKTNMQKAQNL